MEKFLHIVDQLLFLSCFIIIFAGIYLTIKTRFVQFRLIPSMLKLLKFNHNGSGEGEGTVKAHRALFTAMSTTIGISTIVSPYIAIRLGGPGAVVGFLLATILGTAVNYTEVTLALSYRKQGQTGVCGGPMQYLHDAIHPWLAKWYAFFGFILLMSWSAAQANQLSSILNSSLMGSLHISPAITGLILAVLVILILVGGIKRIATVSALLVPLMFVTYVGAGLWILASNLGRFPAIFEMIFQSCFAPKTFAAGATVGGLVGALRWGIFKGLHSNEAGVGTQTIPHSMAEVKDAREQGALAMASTYSAGFICLLSCFIALVTETWLDPSLSLGIHMVASSFQAYFSSIGVIVVVISAFLFAFGTILGNSFNGSQCFSYLTDHRFRTFYYLATAALIFLGSIADIALVWSLTDLLLVPVVVPHILAVVFIARKRKELLFPEPLTKAA